MVWALSARRCVGRDRLSRTGAPMKRLLLLSLILAAACGGSESLEPASPPPGPIADAAPDSMSTMPMDGGDGSTGEPPWIPAPLLGNLNFDRPVVAAVHAGNAWYVAGAFTFADMIPARRLLAVDMAGQPTGCSVEGGFDATVSRTVHIGNALYAVGPFRSYRGQSANRIAKIDTTTCQLRPRSASMHGRRRLRWYDH